MSELASLNDVPEAVAREKLARCCGSSAWVAAMLSQRPFRDRAHLLEAASRSWRRLSETDWLEAFSHHPRIGELKVFPSATASPEWAAHEQAGAAAASGDLRAALVEGNRAYEAKFGRVYLVSATGKSAEELLALLRERMGNDPASELRVAAIEQEKITALRLGKLL